MGHGNLIHHRFQIRIVIPRALQRKKRKNRHDVYLIKKEIHEMGFRGLLGLYSKKANEQYSMGTNGVETKSYSTRSSYFPIYEYLYGNKRDFLFFIDQIIC